MAVLKKIKQSNGTEIVRCEAYFSYGLWEMASTDNQAAMQISEVEDTPGAKGPMSVFEEQKEARMVTQGETSER